MGLFSFLKNKGPKLNDYSDLVTDLHSHLIPGIDDGAKSIEDSVILIKELYNLGFRKLITTPHVMYDGYKNTPEIILKGLEEVRKAIKEKNIDIEINAAAEYFLDEDLVRKIENNEVLSFGKNYLLFELPFMNKPANLESVIFKMQAAQFKPVLAHPERYHYLYDNKYEKYKELKSSGVLLQINILSLAGAYGDGARNIARGMIENELVDFAATDLHHTHHVSILKEALKDKYLAKLIDSGLLMNEEL